MSDVLPRVWMLGCGRHSVPHLHLPWEAGTRRPTGPGWAHSYSSQVRPVHNRVMTPAAVRWDLFTIGLWLLLQSGETHVHNWVMTPTAVRWELFKIGLWLLLQSGETHVHNRVMTPTAVRCDPCSQKGYDSFCSQVRAVDNRVMPTRKLGIIAKFRIVCTLGTSVASD